MEKIKKFIAPILNKTTSITHVFGILAMAIGALLLIYDVRYLLSFGGGWDYINNIIVEAHGLFFDLLVLGVLISIYERKRQKKEAIERDENLIDDFRGWLEPEATFRIVGAIKRLNKLNESDIKLNLCHLQEADLRGANLQGAVLSFTNLKWANLKGVNLQSANLAMANLTLANLQGADLRCAFLKGTNLDQANLEGTNLHGAIVGENWFFELEKKKVRGTAEIVSKYEINEAGVLCLK